MLLLRRQGGESIAGVAIGYWALWGGGARCGVGCGVLGAEKREDLPIIKVFLQMSHLT